MQRTPKRQKKSEELDSAVKYGEVELGTEMLSREAQEEYETGERTIRVTKETEIHGKRK